MGGSGCASSGKPQVRARYSRCAATRTLSDMALRISQASDFSETCLVSATRSCPAGNASVPASSLAAGTSGLRIVVALVLHEGLAELDDLLGIRPSAEDGAIEQ